MFRSILILLLCSSVFFFFSIKLNAQDQNSLDWSIHIDGFNDVEVTASAIDKDGNSYHTLTYTVDLDIQGLNKKFPHSPYVSSALLKVSAAGKPLWAHTISSTKDCRLRAIDFGPSGNIYITGYGDGVVTFESKTKNSSSGELLKRPGLYEPSGVIAACYSPEGSLLWGKKFSSSFAVGLSASCNSKEDVYITFHQNADLKDENGKIISPFKSSTHQDSKQGILKLNKNGEVIGITELSVIRSSSYIHRFGGKFDHNDNYILYGTMYGSYHFGNQDSIYSDVSKSSLDSYIAKFAPDGKLEWFQHIGGRSTQWIRDLDIDKNNNIVALVNYDKECYVSKGIGASISTELLKKYGTDFTFFKIFPNGEMDYNYVYEHPRNAYTIIPLYVGIAVNDELIMTGTYNDTLQIQDKSIYAGYHNSQPMRLQWDKTTLKHLSKMGNSDYFMVPTAQDVKGKYFCGAAHYAGKENELFDMDSKIKLKNRDHGRAAVIYGSTLILEQKEPEALAQQEMREKENMEIINPLMQCLSVEDTHTWLPIITNEFLQDSLNNINENTQSSALSLNEPCYTKKLDLEARVFPNPTREEFSINIAGLTGENIEIQIYSESGQLIFTHRDRSSDAQLILEMNSTGLTAGVYFIRIIANEHQKVLRLTVVK